MNLPFMANCFPFVEGHAIDPGSKGDNMETTTGEDIRNATFSHPHISIQDGEGNLMASRTHLHQLRRYRLFESTPIDAQRRGSPVFGTRPSHRDDIYLRDNDELTLTLSSLIILFFPWIMGPRICVLACPITCVCVCVCLFLLPF